MRKKVSCHIITYNQKNFISQCIDGVLMQKTNFDFELVIGDDNSTDGTRDVLLDYLNKYPGKIILNLREKRGLGIPGKENFLSTLAMCKSEYITLCDGDDYWTDVYKLQKQVDFLEANDDFLIHSGDAYIHIGDSVTNQKLVSKTDDAIFLVNDFYFSNHLVTCTVMFRNTKLNFPNFFKNIVFGDWFLYLLLLQSQPSSKAYRAQDIFAVYRKHQHSVTGSMSVIDDKKNHIKQIIFIKNFVASKNHKAIFQFKLNSWCITCFRLQIDANKNIDACNILMLNIWHCGINIFWRKYFSKIKHDLKFSLFKTL